MAEQKIIEEVKYTKAEMSLLSALEECSKVYGKGCYGCKFSPACEELWDWFCMFKPREQIEKLKFFRLMFFHFRDVRKGRRK